MAEYIEREVALAKLCQSCCEHDETRECDCNERRAILEIYAADVAPVRHGRWLNGGDYTAVCPVCGKRWDASRNQTDDFAYCPNCGARMDGRC